MRHRIGAHCRCWSVWSGCWASDIGATMGQCRFERMPSEQPGRRWPEACHGLVRPSPWLAEILSTIGG
jgi:hypothetical protein